MNLVSSRDLLAEFGLTYKPTSWLTIQFNPIQSTITNKHPLQTINKWLSMLGGFESKPLTHKIQVVQLGFGLGILNGSLFLLRPNESDEV